jgi:N-acetyltransferase
MHSKHHSRVVRGIVWDGLGRGQKGRGGQVKGKGKGKGMDDVGRQVDVGWRVVRDDVRFGRDGRGKIILAEGSWGGAKVSRASRASPAS